MPLVKLFRGRRVKRARRHRGRIVVTFYGRGDDERPRRIAVRPEQYDRDRVHLYLPESPSGDPAT